MRVACASDSHSGKTGAETALGGAAYQPEKKPASDERRAIHSDCALIYESNALANPLCGCRGAARLRSPVLTFEMRAGKFKRADCRRVADPRRPCCATGHGTPFAVA
jgi:hypothetical protein